MAEIRGEKRSMNVGKGRMRTYVSQSALDSNSDDASHRENTNHASTGMWRDFLRRIPPIGFCLIGSPGARPCRAPPTCFVLTTGGVLFEEYGCGGPGVCLGDGDQRETVARWTRRRAAPAYAAVSCLHLT